MIPGRQPTVTEQAPEIPEGLVEWLEGVLQPVTCPDLPPLETPDICAVVALQVARQNGRRDVLTSIRGLLLAQQERRRRAQRM